MKSRWGKTYGGLARVAAEQDLRQVNVEPFPRRLRICESLAAARGLEREVANGLAEYIIGRMVCGMKCSNRMGGCWVREF